MGRGRASEETRKVRGIFSRLSSKKKTELPIQEKETGLIKGWGEEDYFRVFSRTSTKGPDRVAANGVSTAGRSTPRANFRPRTSDGATTVNQLTEFHGRGGELAT